MDSFFNNITNITHSFQLPDLVDILLVAFLFFCAIRLLRETGAIQLLKGVAILAGVYMFANACGLGTIKYLIERVSQLGIMALVIVLQPELRHSLERLGRSRLSGLNLFPQSGEEVARTARAIEAVGEAAVYLSKRRIGALIVFERDIRLGEIIKSGTEIDAVPSPELIGNIFFVNSPLHDGALIVRDGRLCAAGCYLPLSENYTISKEMGTRHRAALGLSESTDAVTVIVSEETGYISIAEGRELRRNIPSDQLVKELNAYLLPEQEEKIELKTLFFNRVKKNNE